MSTVKDMDCLLQSFVDGGLPGCGLQVVQRGRVLYEGYFGCADMETGKPVTESSVFRQASMSKIPLYTVLMMLYEKGKFLLTDPISDFLPEWKNSRKIVRQENGSLTVIPTDHPVTIRDVMSMKCGLPYCNSDAPTDDPTIRAMQERMRPLWQKGHYTLREQLEAMADVPLAFEPGTHWMYGFSSELAAGIVEAVCDKPIDDVFDEFLFEPLGMENTGSRYFKDIRERMVKLYQIQTDGSYGPGPSFFDKKHEPGAEHEAGWGRLFSTVRDYSKLIQMLANGGCAGDRRIMGRKTIDLMRANCLNDEIMADFEDIYNAGYGYGCGVRTVTDQAKGNLNSSPGAFGWTGGFGTWCEADPKEGLSIVYMHNLIPNMETYYHPRMRNTAYGLLD
jgi:CubicO group peptidase (beta-lactamase class C family)